MFEKIKEKIESKRHHSKNVFWQCLVLLKDFAWFVKHFLLDVLICLTRIFGILLPLKYYKKKLSNSKNGEDGVIAEILRRLRIERGWFIEFGAWDGIRYCNTSWLVKRKWKGIYIECDADYFKNLEQNMRNYKDIICIRKKISLEAGSSINDVLSQANIPKDFELAVIDIDGNDYWVWKSMDYSPKVVVIEYNESFGPEESKGIEYDPQFYWDKTTRYYGTSALAMYKLGRQKGYTLVGYVESSLFFVKDEYILDKFKVFDVKSIPRKDRYKPTDKQFIEL